MEEIAKDCSKHEFATILVEFPRTQTFIGFVVAFPHGQIFEDLIHFPKFIRKIPELIPDLGVNPNPTTIPRNRIGKGNPNHFRILGSFVKLYVCHFNSPNAFSFDEFCQREHCEHSFWQEFRQRSQHRTS